MTPKTQLGRQPNIASDETLERIRTLEQQLPAATNSLLTSSSNGAMTLPSFDSTSRYMVPEGWCAIIDLWIRKYNPDVITMVMALSNSLKGEAAN